MADDYIKNQEAACPNRFAAQGALSPNAGH
jgi:hypothetical protein